MYSVIHEVIKMINRQDSSASDLRDVTGVGTLVSSGYYNLSVENTDLINRSSKPQGGSLRKMNETRMMKCCIFDECHG